MLYYYRIIYADGDGAADDVNIFVIMMASQRASQRLRTIVRYELLYYILVPECVLVAL